jgi:N-acetylmuramoyl-L-alanine amidase
VRLRAAFLLWLSASAALAAPAPAKKPGAISAEMRAVVAPGDEIVLEARPHRGETLSALARRLTGDPNGKKAILAANPGLKQPLKRDAWIRVPYRSLSAALQKTAMKTLFPQDRAEAAGWVHTIAAPAGRPESLWRIAEWYTGDGKNYRAIRFEGGLASLQTDTGQKVRVPARLLMPAFRDDVASASADVASASAKASAFAKATADKTADKATDKTADKPESVPLEYGSDTSGRYALYRLQKGEALYSAVVVRFTGRVHAEDVNAKAAEIAARNGIADVRTIPVAFAVRIPIADLALEFRPKDDPERIAEENAQREAARFVHRVHADDLAGVTLVLDAGHGGRDTGALVDGLEEARYVHDLACRVQRLVETHTQAKVFLTVAGDKPCPVPKGDEVGETRSVRVLTTPPYKLEDVVAGVHLRWYLANAILRRSEKGGSQDDRTVFVSLHADSLHPAVRGAMVYIPGEKYLKETYGKSDEIYLARQEVREAPRVSFSRAERLRAEGVSRDLAEKIVSAFRAEDLPLHAFQPIRKNVIRAGREWVPAILRYNRIPARVLLEVCNLNNPEDRRLLVTRAYRERVARAVVSALVDFYGGSGRETVTAGLVPGAKSAKAPAAR